MHRAPRNAGLLKMPRQVRVRRVEWRQLHKTIVAREQRLRVHCDVEGGVGAVGDGEARRRRDDLDVLTPINTQVCAARSDLQTMLHAVKSQHVSQGLPGVHVAV